MAKECAMARQRIVGNYELTEQIGMGSFAVVWKAKDRTTGAEVAVKEISTNKLNKKLEENLISEIDILKRTNHPNIIRLYDTISASGIIYLILEFCAGGDLAGYIQRHGRVSQEAARHFMRQLGAGLQVLRANNLIHRDLKPQNLLLSTNNNNAVLKIADFGFARSLLPQGMAETLCGSPLYMAPEILQQKKYDAKADLWSVGTILYQLVTGQPPFSGQNPMQLLHNIQRSSGLHFPKIVTTELHPECIDLCQKLLRKDPVERLSFEEFFNHPFIADQIKREPFSPNIDESVAQSATPKSFQEEPMPFLLDEEPQFVPNSPKISTSLPRQISPFSLLNSGNTSNRDNLLKKETIMKRKNDISNFSAQPVRNNESAFQSKGTMMDSMDGYVLINMPVPSSNSISLSTNDQNTSPGRKMAHKNSHLNVPVCVESVNSPDLSKSSDTTKETSSVRFPSRLYVLQIYAELIADLASEKHRTGQHLEAFSVQLICLSIWNEALTLYKKGIDGSSLGRTVTKDNKLVLPFMDHLDDKQGAENMRVNIELGFSTAVERAETYAPHVCSLDGDTKMPDAMEIIFQSALTTGRNAAVDELMGNFGNASKAYIKAARLLCFLLVEAASLSVNPPLVLDNSDKQRLRTYIEVLTTRQSQCAGRKKNVDTK